MNSFPTSFQSYHPTAPRDDSLCGGVVEVGTLAALAGQFGNGITALLSDLKLSINDAKNLALF